MKKMKLIFTTFLLLSPVFSYAEYRNLNDVIAKASQEEMSDLPKLLKQIRLVPAENSLMRVTQVDKGSVYEREGIKVGDLLITNKSKSGPKKMMIKQSLKTSAPESSFKE